MAAAPSAASPSPAAAGGPPPETLYVVEPTKLYFPPPHNRRLANVITFRNQSSLPVVYKLAAVQPARYTVRPRLFLVAPGRHIDIQITLLGLPADVDPATLKEGFQLNLVEVAPNAAENLNVKDLWSTGRPIAHKPYLRCVFTEPEAKLPANVRLVIDPPESSSISASTTPVPTSLRPTPRSPVPAPTAATPAATSATQPVRAASPAAAPGATPATFNSAPSANNRTKPAETPKPSSTEATPRTAREAVEGPTGASRPSADVPKLKNEEQLTRDEVKGLREQVVASRKEIETAETEGKQFQAKAQQLAVSASKSSARVPLTSRRVALSVVVFWMIVAHFAGLWVRGQWTSTAPSGNRSSFVA